MFLWWSSYQCHFVYLRVITLSSLLWCSLRFPRQNNVRFVYIVISFVRSCISWFICFLYVSTYTGIPTSFPYQMMFIQFKSYTTGATNRTGTAYPYGTTEFTTVFSWVRFIQSLVVQPQESIIFKRQLKKKKSTCDVNLLSKLSIIFKEWRVVNNMYRGGARV